MSIRSIDKKWRILLGSFLLILISTGFWPKKNEDLDLPKKVDFNYHIRPILSQNCYVCHGNDPGSREAGLRLDNLEDATAELEGGGRAIVPGNLKKSLLVKRITSNDPDFRMPHPEAKKTLSLREIVLLKRWIKQGAKWKKHWAFVKPVMPQLPSSIENTTAGIDHLIHKKLKGKKLESSLPAGKNALIRRVSYILTGLPPKPEEVKAFMTDESDQAYENMVDQYLASPAYGERWARHWMDLVRYGESMGHERDFNISHPFEYRDYLIRAFNQDVPYDLFVKEHLAGDMLKNPRINPQKGFNESQIGTGYFYLGSGKHGPVDTKLEESDKIENVIDVTSKTFQGLTVACARCHDHKFDPIPTADYYSMYGIIESSRLVPKPARKPMDQTAKVKELKALKVQIKENIGNQLLVKAEGELDQDVSDIKGWVANLVANGKENKDTTVRLLVDFDKENWDGWYTDGIAFGEGPVQRNPSIDQKSDEVTTIMTGFASSRTYSTGLQGVLHSPNFVIEHDTIAIRARGSRGLIRIIIDNFHVISDPLWIDLEARVHHNEWRIYKLGIGLAKGHKAYLEIVPGSFVSHIYSINPEDYIDVEYAVAYSGDQTMFSKLPKGERNNPLVEGNQPVDKRGRPIIKGYKRKIPPQKRLSPALSKMLNSSHTKDLTKRYNQIAKELYDPTHFIGLTEGDEIYSSIFTRGSHLNSTKEKMPHQFFTAVEAGPDPFPQNGSGRLAWAESVVDPNNPLTARVMVNRIWHHLFGRGIVETVDNFGLQGKLPTHPDLLDFLAIRFLEDGWSIKRMIKNVLLTEAFQRSTAAHDDSKLVDPDNYHLHHFPVRRMEAEAIRDGILAVSGCLDSQMYGEGVPVYLSAFMTNNPARIALFSGPIDSYGRRSIYRTVRRNFIPEMMLVFDMPVPFSTFGRRNTTNVPAQSLMLLNNPFVHEQSQYWAENLLGAQGLSTKERISDIYIRAFSREPFDEEMEEALFFLKGQAKKYDGTFDELKYDTRLWKDYCHTVINFKEFIHLL